VAKKLGSHAESVDIVIADSTDQQSIDEFVKQTRVVLSTVGPFMKFGTPVVDACVRFGTHYADSTVSPPRPLGSSTFGFITINLNAF